MSIRRQIDRHDEANKKIFVNFTPRIITNTELSFAKSTEFNFGKAHFVSHFCNH